MSTDPLISRSLPGKPWELFPQNLKDWDEHLRAQIMAAVPPDFILLDKLSWLSQKPKGIALFFVLLFFTILIFQYFCPRSEKTRSFLSLFGSNAFYAAIFAFLLALSDLFSSQLKIFIGRLKPHVTFYNPNVLPALSLPSNHAVNTAFLFSLLFFMLEGKERISFWPLYIVGAICVFIVGISRIVFDQHYPLDVLTGWVIGLILGFLVAPFFRRRKYWRRSPFRRPESDKIP